MHECISKHILKYIQRVDPLGLISRAYLESAEYRFLFPDLESKSDDRFRERVLAIRRWLKDQYVLYRDYCTMAQAINAHYVPTTLDDAKKVDVFLFDSSIRYLSFVTLELLSNFAGCITS